MALALVSGVLTAFAHMLVKAGRDKLAVRAWIGLVEFGVALPIGLLVAGIPPPGLWPWLLASGALHLLYQLVLVRSYAANDFAAAFPIARGIAPAAAALLGLLLLGDSLSTASLAGVGLVTLGILLIVRTRALAPAGLAAAVATGLLTAAYTLVDAKGVRLAPDALTFIAWFFALDGLLISFLYMAVRGRRGLAQIAADRTTGLAAGFATLACFGAALWALRLAPVGPVAALRETSILFALLFAWLWLDERVDRRTGIGAAIVALGAVTILS